MFGRSITRLAISKALVIVLAASAAVIGGPEPVAANPGDAWVFAGNYYSITWSQFALMNNGRALLRYRAGAGSTPNSCVKTTSEQAGGWLPRGFYTPYGTWWNYPGTIVKGPAIGLENKDCGNGTIRTELFVHSSYPWTENRYYSYGCIKLASTGTAAQPGGDIASAVFYHVLRGYPSPIAVYY